MCGLAGIYQAKGIAPEDNRLNSMLAPIRHRGPDASQSYRGYQIHLGHNRLSIIAPTNGNQPFISHDQQLVLAVNGEIFNHRELRRELETEGYRFQTDSDCEVILHLYQKQGIECLHKLNGQFAFALWDQRQQKLILARDRFGILPLFYKATETGYLFASEIKALLKASREKPKANLQTLKSIFTFWAPLPGETAFADTFQVKPGHFVEIQSERISQHCYWDWQFPTQDNFIDDENQAKIEFLKRFDQAVALRLEADVGVASFLSGGLDSTSVVASSHHLSSLNTFGISFPNAEFHDESQFQLEAAKYFSIHHHEFPCTAADIEAGFEASIYHSEIPILRTAPTPIKGLAKQVSHQGIKVVLTGEGADEILGGYDIFKESKIRQFWARQPNSQWRWQLFNKLYDYLDKGVSRNPAYVRNFFGKGLDNPDHPFFSHLPRWQTTGTCQQFFRADIQETIKNFSPLDALAGNLPKDFSNWHWLNRAQYLEAHTLLSNYLLPSQSDRMLMAHSVEGRYPFLDHQLVEFCNQLHPRLKIRGLKEKWLLKQAMKGRIPDSVLKRTKQPFRAPDSSSFFSTTNSPSTSQNKATQASQGLIEKYCNQEKLAAYGYFDETKVKLLINKLSAGRNLNQRDNMALVGILSTQIWHEHFIDDCT